MAKRIYSEIPKFKKVELVLRGAVIGFRPVLQAIDTALAGPRKPEEEALLKSIRDQALKVEENARQVLHRLYVEVDSGATP